jgi:long-chain fatty acid transport protein
MLILKIGSLQMKQRVLVAAITAAVLAPAAQASGYKLNEQSAAGAGTAYAGRAAVVQDASIVFYNPAGMVKLKRAEITVGGSIIDATGDFDLDSYKNAAGQPYTSLDNDTYSDGGDFIPTAVVPYAYYARPINEKFAAGFGIFVPFATNTDYKDNFIGGGFADETQLTSVDFQPAIAYRVNDEFSVGFGLDITYMKGLLSKQLDLVPYNANLEGLNGGTGPTDTTGANRPYADYKGFENHYEVEGDDWQLGYNLSMMWDVTSDITLGVTYRSEMKFKLKGDSEFKNKKDVVALYSPAPNNYVIIDADTGYAQETGTTADGTFPKQGSEVPITTPQSLTVSYAQQLTDKLQLVAGATWTQWSVFEDFDVKSSESELGKIEALSNIKVDDEYAGYIGHIEENWKDTTSVAVGANYRLNDDWLLRSGYAYDQSPVRNTYRTARVPDNDRQWLSAGANYRINNDMDIDFAFSYMFFKDAKVNEFDRNVDGSVKTGSSNLQGTYSMKAVGYSLQFNYKI